MVNRSTPAVIVQEQVEVGKAILEHVGLNPAVFEQVALNALITNPDLARCSPESFQVAVIQCVQIGLLPDGKQAALVPFGKTATLIPMWRGRMALARRATPGVSFRRRAVYDREEFTYREGLHAVLKHTPDRSVSRGAKDVIAAYAIARLPKSVEPEFVVMFRSDIERHRAMSRNKNGPGWRNHYAAMAIKTVVHQLCKQLPDGGGLPEIPDALSGYVVEDEMPPITASFVENVPESEAPELEQSKREPEREQQSRAPQARQSGGGNRSVPNEPDPEDDAPF